MGVYEDKNRPGRFYIEFRYKGETYKERLPAGTTKSDALKLEIKIKNDMMFRSHGVEAKSSEMTFERFLVEHFAPHIEAHHSSESFERAINVCKAALKFLKGRTLRSIKPADIERFKISRINLPTPHGTPRKPATVVRELAILSRVFSLAIKNDLCDYNPCSRIERPRFDNVQDKILRVEDEAAFFDAMQSEWARDVCRFVLNTGLRQNDVMGLTRFEIDAAARMIRLVQGKTKRRVVVPLNNAAWEIVERRMKAKGNLLFASPVTGTEHGSVRHAMLRAAKRAGIDPVTIRDLRRTFATRLQDNGTDTATVARMLGHSDLRSIHRYERSLEKMREAADSLTESAQENSQKIRQYPRQEKR